MYSEKTEATQCSNLLQCSLHRPEKLKEKKTVLDSEGWAQQHVKPARMSMKRMSSLRRSWVFCKELSTKIVSPVCATEHTAMIVPWHDERTRTGAFVILPADELFSANKKRSQCELPMTTDFNTPLRTQTIITDKVYSFKSGPVGIQYPPSASGYRLIFAECTYGPRCARLTESTYLPSRRRGKYRRGQPCAPRAISRGELNSC